MFKKERFPKYQAKGRAFKMKKMIKQVQQKIKWFKISNISHKVGQMKFLHFNKQIQIKIISYVFLKVKNQYKTGKKKFNDF